MNGMPIWIRIVIVVLMVFAVINALSNKYDQACYELLLVVVNLLVWQNND